MDIFNQLFAFIFGLISSLLGAIFGRGFSLPGF